MMRQMRENTKWIMLVTAFAFVGLMIFQWGMDASGRSSSQIAGGELGTVNGEPVTYEEYNNVYRSLLERQQAQQQEALTASQTRQLEDAAWNQVVSDKILRQELQRRGIKVSQDEIKQAARYSPPPEFYSNEMFQTNGQFDLDKYHRFLASPAADDRLLMQLEAYYRDAIPRSKLFRQVSSGIYLTDGQLWRMYRDRNEKASVEYVSIDPGAVIPDAAVTVTDAEVRKYYDEHQKELERPERARVEVTTLDKTPTSADTAAVLKHAEELRQQIIGGADFADIAKRESADQGSAEQGGDLGTVQRGQTVPPFDSALFSLPIGQVSQPVRTTYGYHIIQVQSRTDSTATARHILLPIKRQEAAENRLLARADSLEALGESEGLEAAAKDMGLTVRELQLSKGTPFLPVVGSVDEGADWAFGTAGVGDVSPVFENEQAFYMLSIKSIQPAGVMAFDDIKDALRARVTEQKKLAKAEQLARQIVDDVHGGMSLEEAAHKQNLSVQQAGPFTRTDFVPGLGTANAAIGTAFGLDVNQVSAPITVDGKVVIERVVSRQTADRAAFEAQRSQMREQLTSAMEQARLSQFLQDLKDRAKIVDNRDQVLVSDASQRTS